jgi:REP element-mobilizing transposase RayT
MKQLNLIKPTKKEHGGIHSFGRRRSRRPLTTKEPLHVTLRSEFAKGSRPLLRHRPLINYVIKKASKRFDVRVYQKAICGNHIHLLIRGRCLQKTRKTQRVRQKPKKVLGVVNLFKIGDLGEGVQNSHKLYSEKYFRSSKPYCIYTQKKAGRCPL